MINKWLCYAVCKGDNEINILYGWIMNNCNTCINSRPIIAPTSIVDIAVRKWMGNIIKQRFQKRRL